MNIAELANSGQNVQVVLSINDLKEFAYSIVDEIKGESQKENYLTNDETAKLLGVDKSTLWRWRKSGYLVPVQVGGKPRYRQSDITALLEGGAR